MPCYLFVFNETTGTFPERYRVVRDHEAADALRAAEDLTGTVPEAAADAFLEALTARFPPGSASRAEKVSATRWETVARSYAGLFRD
ncbi:hypothetical protein [Roseospira navarrensis]|uniref:Uncharacterized protein n=1 Tax=Roseospira navarrensis TaxID=140058 RepID=A0A7X1ZC22_9PROT|nr:hypothetical protein [Roseospira navarrensis]MQX35804.1 hypothetical protein [Roseospira navarrensis]